MIWNGLYTYFKSKKAYKTGDSVPVTDEQLESMPQWMRDLFSPEPEQAEDLAPAELEGEDSEAVEQKRGAKPKRKRR